MTTKSLVVRCWIQNDYHYEQRHEEVELPVVDVVDDNNTVDRNQMKQQEGNP